MPPPPGSSSHQSRRNPSSSPSPTDPNEPSSSRMSRDSEGYPSWLPKRPPPPAPASTFQSSILGGPHGSTPSPVEPTPFVGGRKPTPRSVRIVNMQDTFGIDKEERVGREGTDHTQGSVHVPPKVWTRASAVPPAAFNASEQDEILPLPQPRFRAKNLNLRILDHPSKWMKIYFYLWPLLVLYHIPLQTFFDFNAVFILLQVAKFPNPQSSGKNWALGAAAYIAAWATWIFVVCLMYELVYSFTRRWRLRRPLMLPIYLSSSAFNYAAMSSYTHFSFLQHIRFSAFTSGNTDAGASSSDPTPDLDDFHNENQGSWKQGIAESCFFYSQNLSTVALLLPRAGLSLALLFSFSSATQIPVFSTSASFMQRDSTFFRQDGSLTDYARGVLIANAAWTAWRILVLLVSWLGLWVFSSQRLGGICGPRHAWEEAEQEKTRSVYSEAASEYGAYRASFYQPGGAAEYSGDELPWEWREDTRIRIQDAFEFCITARRHSASSGAGLRWSGVPVPGYGYALPNRQYRNRHKRWSSGKVKGKGAVAEKPITAAEEEFEGLERVFAAVGLASTASPSRRKVLTDDMFDVPNGNGPMKYPTIAPLQFAQSQPAASTSMVTGLEAPRMVKRNSKDKIPGSAPLMNLPYPFSTPGAGHVSSKDSVPFPAGGSAEQPHSKKGSSSKSRSKNSKGTSSAGTSGSTETSSGSGETGEEEEDDEEEAEEDDDEEDDDELDDDDEEIDDDFLDSEDPSSGRASGSMSSLGQPISPSRGIITGTRRPVGAGHGRNMSGVSSALSGQGISSGSHAHSQSMSSSYGTTGGAGMSVLSQSTGNPESTDSEHPGRGRASLSLSSSRVSAAVHAAISTIPMPPRHPHLQGQGRGRSATTSGATPSASYTLSNLSTQTAPIAFPLVQPRSRVQSGRGIVVDPAVLYADSGISFDMLAADDDGEGDVLDDEEQHDLVGLLGVPTSPRTSLLGGSRISLTASSSSGEARSRTQSIVTRSRHSSTNARSRSRTHSAHSVRDRTNSLGASMRSLIQGATASLSQLELVMRGATGPAAGLGGLGVGSRPRSRVNSSMARVEEGVEYAPSATEMTQRNRDVSGGSSSSGSASQAGSAEVAVNHLVERTRREEAEAEGYSSSAGTHSRSGSDSLSAENYTFGRPILFMRPAQEVQAQTRVDEEDEIVLEARDAPRSDEGSERSVSIPIPIVIRAAEQEHSDPPLSESYTSASFYSLNPSERTATSTPVPIHAQIEGSGQPQSPPQTPEHSPERQGIDIPWRNNNLLTPPADRWGHHGQGAPTTDSGSPPDISTAAGSFVTAPATVEGATTTTESSGGRTISGSWETEQAVRPVGVRSGGMVERPGDDMGLDAGAWRVV